VPLHVSNELPPRCEHRHSIELAVRGALADCISADHHYVVNLVPFELDECRVLVRLMSLEWGLLDADIFQTPFEDLAGSVEKWRR